LREAPELGRPSLGRASCGYKGARPCHRLMVVCSSRGSYNPPDTFGDQGSEATSGPLKALLCLPNPPAASMDVPIMSVPGHRIGKHCWRRYWFYALAHAVRLCLTAGDLLLPLAHPRQLVRSRTKLDSDEASQSEWGTILDHLSVPRQPGLVAAFSIQPPWMP